MRIVQLSGPEGRRLAMVEGASIRLLRRRRSVVDLASFALGAGVTLTRAVEQNLDTASLEYAPI